jgi:hypothetical protein
MIFVLLTHPKVPAVILKLTLTRDILLDQCMAISTYVVRLQIRLESVMNVSRAVSERTMPTQGLGG